MKTTILVKKEIEVWAIRIHVPVHYEEQDIPNDFPLRRGKIWEATVLVDSGKILDWPKGKSGSIEMKVCDSGRYTLLDPCFREIKGRHDYVPNLIPGEYGDYIDLKINEEGFVTNWPINPKVDDFFENDDDD